MKKRLLAAIFPALIAGQTPAAPAHGSFPGFWSDFRAAVAQGDARALGPLIKRPAAADIRPLSPEAYLGEQIKTLGKLRRCLAKAKPARDGHSYSVFCGDQGLFFDQVDGEYKFVEFFAND